VILSPGHGRPRTIALAAGLLLLALPAPAQAFDVSIAGVHVNQGQQASSRIQTELVPLVAHRSTAVRAELGSSSGALQDVRGVRGVLKVSVDGQEITPAAGIPALNEPLDPVPPGGTQLLLDSENATLNFELPYSTRVRLAPRGAQGTVGFLRSNDVDVRVELTASNDDNPANNATDHVGGPQNLTVQRQPVTTVLYTRATLNGQIPSTPPDANFIRRGVGSAFFFGALPLDDSCPACLYRRGVGDLTFDQANSIGAATNGNAFLDFLEQHRQGIVIDNLAAARNVHLYAWLPSILLGENGAGRLNAFVAYGMGDETEISQSTIGHELTHNFGVNHNDTDQTLSPDTGWDVGGRLNGTPGATNPGGAPARVRASTLSELMNPTGRRTRERWTSLARWRGLAAHPNLAPIGDDVPNRPCHTLRINGNFPSRYVVLRPWIWRIPLCFSGAEFEPLRALRAGPGASAAAFPGTTPRGESLADVVLRDGRRTRRLRLPFTARNIFDGEKSETVTRGGFSLTLAARPGERVASVRFLDRATGRRIGALRASARRPSVRIVSPPKDGRLVDGTRVRWRATDADTPDRALRFRLAFSPNGSDWVPLSADVRGRSRAVAGELLPATRAGAGRLRVYASDGAHTSFSEVRGLSIRRPSWAIERARPVR